MSKVAFIGLGVMGYPMAGHLSKHYETTVYNRNSEKSKKWISCLLYTSPSPRD